MNILIITFTSGVNPGTFMQALGVQTAMKLIYPDADVSFLNFPDFKRAKGIGVRGSKDSIWHTVLQKGFAAYRLIKYNALRKRHFHYTKFVDLFNYTKEDEEYIKQFDLVVIGSDTILEKAYGDKGQIGLNWLPLDVPKIYFAASASPANFKPTLELAEVAKNAKYIGLRDQLTVNLFTEGLGIKNSEIFRQPDPSYFLDIDKFYLNRKIAAKFDQGKKYALYDFNSNFPLRKELADSIRECGYTVVATAYNPYADICFDTIDAFDWADIFRHVDIVVTERFHDSVFGLRNVKPVIAIDWDANRFSLNGDSKTYRILQDYDLEQLHFNLATDNRLDNIIKAIQNIDNIFDKDQVTDANLKYYAYNEEILKKIKECLG